MQNIKWEREIKNSNYSVSWRIRLLNHRCRFPGQQFVHSWQLGHARPCGSLCGCMSPKVQDYAWVGPHNLFLHWVQKCLKPIMVDCTECELLPASSNKTHKQLNNITATGSVTGPMRQGWWTVLSLCNNDFQRPSFCHRMSHMLIIWTITNTERRGRDWL